MKRILLSAIAVSMIATGAHAHKVLHAGHDDHTDDHGPVTMVAAK